MNNLHRCRALTTAMLLLGLLVQRSPVSPPVHSQFLNSCKIWPSDRLGKSKHQSNIVKRLTVKCHTSHGLGEYWKERCNSPTSKMITQCNIPYNNLYAQFSYKLAFI